MKMTIGQMMDSLSIVNIRMWNQEDLKRDKKATNKEIADATKKTNVLNQQRNDLIQSIDEEINYMVKTGELQMTYKQGDSKSYGQKK